MVTGEHVFFLRRLKETIKKRDDVLLSLAKEKIFKKKEELMNERLDLDSQIGIQAKLIRNCGVPINEIHKVIYGDQKES